MAAALESAEPKEYELTDADMAYVDEILEDALATKAAKQTNFEQQEELMQIANATQDDGTQDNDSRGHCDRLTDILASQYSTLTAKTRRIMEVLNILQEMMNNLDKHGTPYEILKAKYNDIKAMLPSEEKNISVKMFNVINTVYNECRVNPEVRMFVGKLFMQTDMYYSMKEKRRELKEELDILIHLRDEQELENFKAKQKKRLETEFTETSGKVKRSKQ